MNENWGGSWTEEKLITFQKYVEAYLKVIYGAREKWNGWPKEIIYLDGFAGSGSRSVISDLDNDYFFQKEYEVYKGSCERVLQLEKKFDKYIFVDIEKNSLDELKNLLQNKKIDIKSCEFVEKDINNYLEEFINSMNNQKLALILLDPFGMQLKWSSIEKFKSYSKGIDLWILIPSGISINRLLDSNGEIKAIEKLTEFFGMTKEEIRNEFYKENPQATLFEETNIQIKIKNSIQRIAELYVSRLKTIFKYVTKKPLELKNSKNLTIFHFVFASQNQVAHKIASQIIKRQQEK